MMADRFSNWMAARLALQLPGEAAQHKMMNINRPSSASVPEQVKHSAVLMILYREEGDIHLVLIQRVNDGGIHSGQIALPGGRQDPEDASLEATALREAQEEVGLSAQDVTILGRLTNLYIPVSNFLVQPIVGYADSRPLLHASDSEVARILTLPLREVFSRKEQVSVQASATRELVMNVNAYILESNTILWGATAMMLSELEVLWNEYAQSSLSKS
jgi:8-oxo-dGTP pyrophosphatase MutT (NUDIX family)